MTLSQLPLASMEGHRVFELLQPREWLFGVGLSFQLSGLPMVLNNQFVDNKDAPVMVIGSAGADFDV